VNGIMFIKLEKRVYDIATAYELIRTLSSDLRMMGFITINGRVSRQYFYGDLPLTALPISQTMVIGLKKLNRGEI